MLDSACDECPIDRFVVTDVCRGCIGHRCLGVCPEDAISVVNHRAYTYEGASSAAISS